nr:hypothetical protein [Tanacetum cinerariifolium]
MMTDKDSSAAGTDNRPPMLEENDYESWRIRIERYIKGKPHGKLIWKSIQNGPTPHPQTTDPASEGGAVPPPRNKRDEGFTEEDIRNELADIQAINILSQGLPRRIFNILNQNETGREIWVNLELLMKGSGQTLEQRKEALFDEFERFRANGNELIQDYFFRFHKLVNDMKVTQVDIPTHQLNTKFANNLPSYWGKYVTHAKNNMNMSTVTYVELFTHLRTYEEHALKSLKKKEQSSAVVDPLAYLGKTTPTHSTTSPVTVPTPQSSGDSHNDAMLATMNQIANLLSGLQKQFPPTNNQLRTSSNLKTHATVHDGQIVTETVQRRDPGNTGTKGIQTTGSGVNNSGKKLSWPIFLPQVAQTQEEHLNSKVDSVLDDNMITYDEYQNDCGVEAVPTVVSADEADKQSMIAVLQRMHTEITGYVKIVTETVQRRAPDAEAKAFFADVECTAPYDQPLALTTTNLFEANHEDAYDSDVDEGPHASAAFMANLSFTGGINSQAQVTSMWVNDEHKLVNATLTAELEWCKIEMQALERNKVKHDLDMAIVERNK